MYSRNLKTLRILSGTIFFVLAGCTLAAAPQQNTKLPNPAVAKCISDGWRTEPVLTQGVPTGTVCIEPLSGLRCEAWAYFRGECPSKDTVQQYPKPQQ